MGYERSVNSRPNIILIMVDDMGYSDLGCFGSEIQTSNLDQMAEQGIRFTQTYNYARCCPSRACLLTGLYPHQAGVGHMVSDVGGPAYQGYLRDNCVTVAEALQAGGYRTLMSGKWHVGGTYHRHDPSGWSVGDPHRPLPPDRGFDLWYGTPAGAGSYFNPKPLFQDYNIIEPEAENYYYTEALTDQAVSMIELAAQEDRPFFLYLAYTAPHWPLHALEEDIAKYQGKYRDGWDAVRTARHEELKSMGVLDARWPISPRHVDSPDWDEVEHKEWEDRRMAVYAAQVDRVDKGVGRITAKLHELALDENTLVIFLSDNGGCAELLREDGVSASEWPTTRDGRPVRFGNRPDIMPGDPTTYQSYDLPWANASNTPFRLFKHWVHEGGISTPMIARWPKMMGDVKGTINHEVVHIIDFMATFLDMAGISYPSEYKGHTIQPLEGESFLPALRGENWQRERPLFWEHEGNAAVRDGRWKLVRNYPGAWELYDMVVDRTELNDLSTKHKPQVEKMVKAYREWVARVGVLPWEDVRALYDRVS